VGLTTGSGAGFGGVTSTSPTAGGVSGAFTSSFLPHAPRKIIAGTTKPIAARFIMMQAG
jgi:hypothetical protein